MLSVEVLSHEMIKPSSPTPPHLQTHKLSWLDLMTPPVDMSMVIFYSNYDETTLPILKNSLSETLTLFYPLAGRRNPNDTSVVDCNDQGIDLFVTQAEVDFPNYNELVTHLLPPSESAHNSLLSIQITVFSSGRGTAIGVSMSHTLADCHSFSEFITTWAAVARGESHPPVERPLFDAASRFLSPVTFEAGQFASPQALRAGELVTRRFVFEEAAIETLRKCPVDRVIPPTRVVAVASLLWRCCVRAREAAKASGSASVACIPFNMRGRAGLGAGLPDRLFGNVSTAAVAVAASAEVVGERSDEAKHRSEEKMRNAISKRDEEWITRVQGVDGKLMTLELLAEPIAELGDQQVVDYYFFSSWTKFPFSDADFGWGKPMWVAPGTFFGKNYVALMGRGDEVAGGMEAWMKLEEDEMMELEKDEELMSFANPAYNNFPDIF